MLLKVATRATRENPPSTNAIAKNGNAKNHIDVYVYTVTVLPVASIKSRFAADAETINETVAPTINVKKSLISDFHTLSDNIRPIPINESTVAKTANRSQK
jgi:hypothetical protein